MKKFFSNKIVRWSLPVFFLGLSITFSVTGFCDTVGSDGLIFATIMQHIPVVGCAGLSVMAIKGW